MKTILTHTNRPNCLSFPVSTVLCHITFQKFPRTGLGEMDLSPYFGLAMSHLWPMGF